MVIRRNYGICIADASDTENGRFTTHQTLNSATLITRRLCNVCTDFANMVVVVIWKK